MMLCIFHMKSACSRRFEHPSLIIWGTLLAAVSVGSKYFLAQAGGTISIQVGTYTISKQHITMALTCSALGNLCLRQLMRVMTIDGLISLLVNLRCAVFTLAALMTVGYDMFAFVGMA